MAEAWPEPNFALFKSLHFKRALCIYMLYICGFWVKCYFLKSPVLKTIIIIITLKHIQLHCHSVLPPMISHHHSHPFFLPPGYQLARLSQAPCNYVAMCQFRTRVRPKWHVPHPGPVITLPLPCLPAGYLPPRGTQVRNGWDAFSLGPWKTVQSRATTSMPSTSKLCLR